jgi:hypothetical protein
LYDAPSTYNNNTPSWTLSGAPYKRILSTDAGATFFNGTTASSFSTPADFAAAVQSVDILMDESVIGSTFDSFLQNYNLSATATLKFIQNKAVFREDGLANPNNGRDWFGGAVAMDDAVLQDLVRAIHPELFKISQYNWIRNIAKNEPQQLLTSANCTAADDATSPVPDRALSCANLQAGVSSGNGGASVNSGGLVNSVLTLVLGVFATLAILF